MIKQTQTKLYDFSDVDLDISSGSKLRFPEAFKKFLNTGYNSQVVTSYTTTGNIVTLTYSSPHNYVANRVLLISSSGFEEEIYIDSVTSNTLTFEFESFPTSLSNPINTKIAPLGWDLVYEQSLVQLYKMKYLDERDLYVRFVFCPGGTTRHSINVCVGKTANESTGIITDSFSFEAHRANTSVISGFEWMFSVTAVSTHDNYTYSQGLTEYGLGCIIGSKYHLSILCNVNYPNVQGRILGIFPVSSLNYSNLDYPVILGSYSTSALSSTSSNDYPQLSSVTSLTTSPAILGNTPVHFMDNAQNTVFENIPSQRLLSSYLPSNIDSFQTSTAQHISLFERTTKQYVGTICGGLLRASVLPANMPSLTRNLTPFDSTEIDFQNNLKVHFMAYNTSTNSVNLYVVPIEEIKIGL